MKSKKISTIIFVVSLAILFAIFWFLSVKVIAFCIFILQIITLLAIGGTNFNISNNIQKHSEHEQPEQAPYQGEEEA